jgi:hypothetical protein
MEFLPFKPGLAVVIVSESTYYLAQKAQELLSSWNYFSW